MWIARAFNHCFGRSDLFAFIDKLADMSAMV
jgi:hypothetical protein